MHNSNAADDGRTANFEQLPVARSVDVVIVGGGSGAVACALAARQAGRSVFMVAPRAYLGEDIAADFDYWPAANDAIESDLAKAVFAHGRDAPPTPMHVKRTLEQAMVRADVPFVLNAHAAGVLRDEAVKLCGVVIANRAGRQAVIAGAIVDATDRALVARQAGVAFTPFPAGTYEATHVVLGGEPAADESVEVETLRAMTAGESDEPVEVPAYRCRVKAELADGRWSTLAQAQAEVVSRCWRPGVLQQSERLRVAWPDHVKQNVLANAWDGAGSFDVDALKVEARLHVLGACAPVTREVAAAMTRPAHAMTVGARLGVALAGAACAGGVSVDAGTITASCACSEVVAEGAVRTLLDGLRPVEGAAVWVRAKANELPVLGRYDVVVIGGGTGGGSAGIGAGRAGASTLVCENLSMLGGVGTAGQISKYWFGNLVGFTHEMDQAVSELEVVEEIRNHKAGWSPAAKAAWQHRESAKAGVTMFFGTVCCGAWVVDDAVRGVVIAGPYGYGLVEAGAVVDSTGCADVAAAAGAPTRVISHDHVAVQGVGLAGINPVQAYRNTDHNFSDDTDPIDAATFLVSSKLKFKDAFDMGQLVDSRERRQIVGDVSLTPFDFLAERRFPDTVCVSSSNFDTHGFTVHPLFTVKAPDKQRLWVDVPYRCLLPRGLDGLLVTGLGVSAHRDALPVIRMQGDVQNQGYAAGVAAAMAATQGTGVRSLDVKALQKRLVDKGNLPERVLSDVDNFPLPDERVREAVASGWDDYEGLAICFHDPARSMPMMRDALDRTADDVARVRYALILGLLGDDHGEAVLRETIAARTWDEGWNYTGMGQFGLCLSEVDALLTALGLCGSEGAWEVVLEKIEQLPDEPDFSHCRAVAEACEQLCARHGDERAAGALADVLRRPGMRGHVQQTLAQVQAAVTPNGNETTVRNVALRELHLARAVYRCGDDDGIGAATLAAYVKDLRGHFARHARAVLAEKSDSPTSTAGARAEAGV